jgi:hypothetical protein
VQWRDYISHINNLNHGRADSAHVRGWLPAQYTGMLESSEGPRLALFQCLFYKNHQLAFSALVSTSSRVLTRNTLNTIGTKQNAFYCH